MARVNYREIRERFTHIDATFESCVISMPGDSHYSVRFYAWWEHPTYLDLTEPGAGWQAKWPREAEKVVTVYPAGLIKACIRRTDDVIDWSFVDSPHPLLWEFETEEHVLCKGALPPGVLTDLPSMIAAALPYHADPASLASLLNPLRWGDPRFAESGRGGFSLGRFPASVVGAVRSVLDDLGVEYLDQAPPVPSETLPIMLLIDGEDCVIAEDFEVDAPDFEHDADWVTSTR
jgi:hypothetical protein